MCNANSSDNRSSIKPAANKPCNICTALRNVEEKPKAPSGCCGLPASERSPVGRVCRANPKTNDAASTKPNGGGCGNKGNVCGGGGGGAKSNVCGSGSANSNSCGGGGAKSNVCEGGSAKSNVCGGGSANSNSCGGGGTKSNVCGGGSANSNSCGGGGAKSNVCGGGSAKSNVCGGGGAKGTGCLSPCGSPTVKKPDAPAACKKDGPESGGSHMRIMITMCDHEKQGTPAAAPSQSNRQPRIGGQAKSSGNSCECFATAEPYMMAGQQPPAQHNCPSTASKTANTDRPSSAHGQQSSCGCQSRSN